MHPLDPGVSDTPKKSSGNGGGSNDESEPFLSPSLHQKVASLSCDGIGWQGGGPMDGVLRNIIFVNTGNVTLPPNTPITFVSSTGQTETLYAQGPMEPNSIWIYPNVFPNGIPADFECDVIIG